MCDLSILSCIRLLEFEMLNIYKKCKLLNQFTKQLRILLYIEFATPEMKIGLELSPKLSPEGTVTSTNFICTLTTNTQLLTGTVVI